MTSTFFLQVDSSFNWTTFGLVWTKYNHFKTIFYHFGVFSGEISNHCAQFLLISQHGLTQVVFGHSGWRDGPTTIILPILNLFWGQIPIFSWVTPTFFPQI